MTVSQFAVSRFLDYGEIIGLSAASRFILTELANHCRKKFTCHLKHQTLAKRTAYSISTIQRSLKQLEDVGIITIVRKPHHCIFSFTDNFIAGPWFKQSQIDENLNTLGAQKYKQIMFYRVAQKCSSSVTMTDLIGHSDRCIYNKSIEREKDKEKRTTNTSSVTLNPSVFLEVLNSDTNKFYNTVESIGSSQKIKKLPFSLKQILISSKDGNHEQYTQKQYSDNHFGG